MNVNEIYLAKIDRCIDRMIEIKNNKYSFISYNSAEAIIYQLVYLQSIIKIVSVRERKHYEKQVKNE